MKLFSEELLESMFPNGSCDSLHQNTTSVLLVTVNECPFPERQPDTIHICKTVLYF